MCIASPDVAAQHVVPPAQSGLPLSDSLLDLDARFTALRVTQWNDGDAKMLLLEQDVVFNMGNYGFIAQRAVVRIEPERYQGSTVWHLAVYLDRAAALPGRGRVRAEAGRLLVTAATRGKVTLDEPGLLERVQAAPALPLIGEAMLRVTERRTALSKPTLRVPDEPIYDKAVLAERERRREEIVREQARLYRATPGSVDQRDVTVDQTQRDEPEPTILPARGAVAYAMDSWSVQLGDEETAVSLIGNVRLVFEDYRDDRVVTLKAQNVVLFLAGDDAAEPTGPTGNLDAADLRGVYLEGAAIITDGDYTVRAPRVYYDLAQNRATLLDAVFYTYDLDMQVPLYVRAAKVRQTSATSFQAEDAKLTTSEFGVPHFSIGAGELTVRQYEDDHGQRGAIFTAKDSTLNLGDTPVFYWPEITAYGRSTPLRRVRAGYSSNNGPNVQTDWDLFALTGQLAPDGAEWYGEVDYLGDHGPALGSFAEYDTDTSLGEFRGYFLPSDDGEDEIADRLAVNQQDETRGYGLIRHRQYLPSGFEFTLEGSYVSDPTFLEEFFPDQAYDAKEYESSVYLKKQDHDSSLEVLATTQLSDFTPQLTRLQSYGYEVDRYPEVGYSILSRPLFDDTATLYSQTTFSQLRIRGGQDTPADRGFTAAQSNRFFGIGPNTSFDDRLNALGIPTDTRMRFDSRHEITMPRSVGALDVTPYAVGRFTAYDSDFNEFNGGTNNDQSRLWGQAGLRVGTEFSRGYGNAQSSTFDVNGLRHIVEPSATLFVTGSTLDADDLPVYDRDVEGLSDASGARFGVTNTWQTRRGGLGRQRTVDWITWRTDLVLRSDDSDVATEVPRYYDYRPEYSVGGDHLFTELLWMVTDTLGVAGQLTHSLETDRVAQWRVGAGLDHTPRLRSFLSYEEIDPLDSQLMSYGFTYRLTTKYQVGVAQTIDFGDENGSRQFEVTLDRRLPRWILRLTAEFDELEDEQTFGIALIPEGSGDDSIPAFY